ncbi:hypothetical protein M0811_03292 [Anaeramoeba ignava]|uniref:Uncharacterized protein n=1 Tax=Anaeramoeba ignava TaxID=1746090 RepID=A0A9Q0L6J6_ANAIG|nr:hypothetical protein M0811_03292 [Anaeramoeba ignava]
MTLLKYTDPKNTSLKISILKILPHFIESYNFIWNKKEYEDIIDCIRFLNFWMNKDIVFQSEELFHFLVINSPEFQAKSFSFLPLPSEVDNFLERSFNRFHQEDDKDEYSKEYRMLFFKKEEIQPKEDESLQIALTKLLNSLLN